MTEPVEATTTDIDRCVDAVLSLVTRNRVGTSFVEITRVLESEGLNVSGTCDITIGKNIVIWGGVSEAYVDVIRRVQATRQTHLVPTTPLVYMYDGAYLNLPVAKRPPAAGYREPHWAPCVLNSGPYPST